MSETGQRQSRFSPYNFLGGIAAAAGVYAIFHAFVPQQIEHGQAQAFLAKHYFAEAPRDPDRVLRNLTTDNYQELQASYDGVGYVDFWRLIDRVEEVRSVVVAGHKNVFKTRWTLVYKSGKRVPISEVHLKLKCDGWRYWMPAVIDCDAEQLRLDDSLGRGSQS